jgi:hypothetical protein
VSSYLGPLFCSTGLHVCFCASTMLFLLLLLCNIVWSWVSIFNNKTISIITQYTHTTYSLSLLYTYTHTHTHTHTHTQTYLHRTLAKTLQNNYRNYNKSTNMLFFSIHPVSLYVDHDPVSYFMHPWRVASSGVKNTLMCYKEWRVEWAPVILWFISGGSSENVNFLWTGSSTSSFTSILTKMG